jgi:hypothetical protein
MVARRDSIASFHAGDASSTIGESGGCAVTIGFPEYRESIMALIAREDNRARLDDPSALC